MQRVGALHPSGETEVARLGRTSVGTGTSVILPGAMFAAFVGRARGLRRGLALVVLIALAAATEAETRVALVIGNASYASAPLANPVNDARAIGARLGQLGFEVTTLLDAPRRTMEEAVLDFASRLNEDTAAVFYFAGHGVQSRGRNYLMPVDAAFKGERELRFEGLDISFVLEELELARSRVSFVILDACRNNPFASRYRGLSRGLSAIDAARGTLIAYATAPGSVAADGEQSHGLYSGELLRALERPGLKAEEVFKQVRVAVSQRSGGAQTPWESSSLTGDFVFHPGAPGAASGAASAGASRDRSSDEATFWESVRGSDDPRMLKAYLRRYPNGTFAELATLRLEAIGGGASRSPGEDSGGPRATLGTTKDASPPQNGLGAAGARCPNLPGTWLAVTPGALCEASVYFEEDGAGNYRFAQDGCGDPTGTAALNGRELTVRWSQALCAGHSVYRLDETCELAVGEVVLETNFLLCTGRHASSLKRTGDATAPPSQL